MKDEVNSQPVKLVIEHIKKQIAERQILPGERLPSERKLSELLKVSRSHVREALQKMELYGIVKHILKVEQWFPSSPKINWIP